MNNKSYQNLIQHLPCIDSSLENIASANVAEEEYECPICQTKHKSFLPAGKPPRPHAKCPNCKSMERHRELFLVMKHTDWHRAGMRVLHFAPESIFYNLFSSFKDIDYWPVDLNPKMRGVKKAVDITNITFDDDSFDLIMCTHVLEHIPDDRKAMNELYRVLKTGGIAFLNVPIYDIPVTFENPEYNTPALQLKYFGQRDHVRKYGLDYPERLKATGFTVQMFSTKDMDEKLIQRYGLRKNGKTFLCRKE